MTLVSLPHLCMLDATPPELVRAAASAGFDAVGIRLQPTMQGEKQHPMLGDTPMMQETLAVLNDTGLKVLDIETIWLRPDTEPKALIPVLEAAARLGAQSIQAVGGDENVASTYDKFAELAELARPLNLRVEYEYMAISAVKSLAIARDILEKSGADNVGILVDTLHIARCNTPIAELAALPGRFVNVLQLCDAPKAAPPTIEAMFDEARYGRLLPGDGELALAEAWDVMPAHANVSVEVPLATVRHLPFAERAQAIMTGYNKFCLAHGRTADARRA
jgi:sugar phosphate isomerase/epimerase